MLLNKLSLEISKIKIEKESLTSQLNTYLLDINKLKDENTSIIKKYDDIKNEYELLNKNYQETIYILEKTNYDKLELQNKLNFELSLKENLENELSLLRSHSKTIELEKIISNHHKGFETLSRLLLAIEVDDYESAKKIHKDFSKQIKYSFLPLNFFNWLLFRAMMELATATIALVDR